MTPVPGPAGPYGDAYGNGGGNGYGGYAGPYAGAMPPQTPAQNQPGGPHRGPGGQGSHGGPHGGGRHGGAASGSGQPQQPLVRPYAMTGGRTRPRYQLAIEALVSTTATAERSGGLLPEHARIVALCRDIKSVAEVSALLSIPLGVARILVADLAEAGLVAIHQPTAASESGGQPDVTLLERVLSGLRKL